MTPVTLDSGEYLMVDVPEDASDIQIHEVLGTNENCLTYFSETPMLGTCKIYIPAGNWSIVGRGNELTDEQWSGIVDSKIERDYEYNNFYGHFKNANWLKFYRNYLASDPSTYSYRTPTQSGLSLIQHHGMKPSCVILKKQK